MFSPKTPSWFLIHFSYNSIGIGGPMKKLILVSSILFSTLVCTAAVKNPQIRACNQVGGQFLVVSSEEDQIGLCKIGLSYVGAIDILNRDAQIEIPLSLNYYKKGVQACPSKNITLVYAIGGDDEISVCMYNDNSIIDIETLSSGFMNDRNTELNKVLGLVAPTVN
jgi:hypothetical protein